MTSLNSIEIDQKLQLLKKIFFKQSKNEKLKNWIQILDAINCLTNA